MQVYGRVRGNVNFDLRYRRLACNVDKILFPLHTVILIQFLCEDNRLDLPKKVCGVPGGGGICVS